MSSLRELYPVHYLIRQCQRLVWIYVTEDFSITRSGDFTAAPPAMPCTLVPITSANHARVQDFRDEHRVSEYRDKLCSRELGYFAECDGAMVGSIWATLNRGADPIVVKRYLTLRPHEALLHDLVIGDHFRGHGIGPFMISECASILLHTLGVARVVTDVSSRNHRALRMYARAGMHVDSHSIYASVLGRPLVHLRLEKSR